jgi:dipeptidyl-peptidase-4
MTWPTLDAQLLADAAATFNFRLGLPSPLAVTADGAVLFRRTPPRDFAASLYELDTRTGAVRELMSADGDTERLSDAEAARRERSRTVTRGVVDIDVSDDGHTVLVPLAGMLYLLDRRGGGRVAIDPGGEAYDPHLSPDASKIAFVRDGDLWVIGRTGPAKRLTKHPEGFEYGVAEFVAQEELDRRRGFWWVGSDRLVFQRSDLRPVDTIYVADARHNDKPPVPFKYPRAGRPNAKIDLGMIDASVPGPKPEVPGPEPKWLAVHGDYIARVSWPDVVTLPRAQDEIAIGDLVVAHSDTWIDVPRPGAFGYRAGTPLHVGPDSFLWDAGETLQLRTKTSTTDLTSPEFGFRKLVGYDDSTRSALVEASVDPTRSDIWRVPLAGGAPTRITAGDGVSTASYEHGVLVVTTLFERGGRRTIAIARDGRSFELPSVAEQPKLVPTTQLETVELGGRTHHAAITRPRAFDPHRKYPVLLKVYAGPHLQMVDVARDGYVMDQWYADAGFVVVRSDGRGTPNRGAAWEHAIARDLITVPLADQIGALQALGARHPELDLARVGVFGWSFGGYFSAMAVLLRPDVFKCAIAGAPVTDWALYDSTYTERYMQTPEQNPEGYARTSALTHAAQLTRPLMIIHGITDDNVHFAHTLALVESLYAAGKYATVITLSATHMVPDPKLNLAREQVQIDFFREHL